MHHHKLTDLFQVHETETILWCAVTNLQSIVHGGSTAQQYQIHWLVMSEKLKYVKSLLDTLQLLQQLVNVIISEDSFYVSLQGLSNDGYVNSTSAGMQS